MSAGFGPVLIVGFGLLTHPHRINNKTRERIVRKNAKIFGLNSFLYMVH